MNKQEIAADSAAGLYYAAKKHLMQDEKPSGPLALLFDSPAYPEFTLLYRMKTTKQSPVHHPEGNVWNHTMLVVDQAARLRGESNDPAAFMLAAFLHDIGKPDTTKVRKGRITSYGHEKTGAVLAENLLASFGEPSELVERAGMLVRYHMQILFVSKNFPFADIRGMQASADLYEIALLGFCDRMGRTGADRMQEEENICVFLQKCGKPAGAFLQKIKQ